jgi:hypothetical protein
LFGVGSGGELLQLATMIVFGLADLSQEVLVHHPRETIHRRPIGFRGRRIASEWNHQRDRRNVAGQDLQGTATMQNVSTAAIRFPIEAHFISRVVAQERQIAKADND